MEVPIELGVHGGFMWFWVWKKWGCSICREPDVFDEQRKTLRIRVGAFETTADSLPRVLPPRLSRRCEVNILTTIADPTKRQSDVARLYRRLLTKRFDGWPAVNAAIAKRWGKRGIERIKQRAWKGVKP